MMLVLLLASVASHSWVGCTDYRGDVNYYEDGNCIAYPRNWAAARSGFLTVDPKGYQLGGDSGYNFQGPDSCQFPFETQGYTDSYPMAVYEQGGTYCLAWPTKNHAAADCTNPFIPDTKLEVFRSGPNPTADPTNAQFEANPVPDMFGTHAQGVIDCLGFQRAPKFCEDTDKALGTGCFQIAAGTAPGKYVFQWRWEFNAGSPYYTCWDAEVVAPGTGKGSGGLLNAAEVVDTLSSAGTTCRSNWASVPTPDGSSSTGTGTTTDAGTSTTTGATTGTTTSRPPLTGDSVVIQRAPSEVPPTGSFDVSVLYSATADGRVITADILLIDGTDATWYGKGTATVAAGSDLVDITVTFDTAFGTPAVGTGYVVRAWMVSAEAALTADPWAYELSRSEAPIEIGTKIAYATSSAGSSTTSTGSSSGTTSSSDAATEVVGGCTSDDQCEGGVCKMDGLCHTPKSSGAAVGILATMLAFTCVLLVAVGAGAFFYGKSQTSGSPPAGYAKA